MANATYDPFDAMRFGSDECFLCGAHLNGNRSDEHIFPEWLLHRHNLWDQHLILLNGTSLPYGKLTIPCCMDCNTGCLSRLENTAKYYVEGGYDRFINIDRLTLYQWLCKIWYGLLFKEQFLNRDRKDPQSGPVMPTKVLGDFKTIHQFLQSVHIPFRFEVFHPWSIFIFRTHTYGDIRDFDYHDGVFTLTFSIRMGDIGVVACLDDSGAQELGFSSYWSPFQEYPLHWLQFSEIAAQVAYKSSLLNRQTHYVSVMDEKGEGPVHVAGTPLQGFSTEPIYDDWITEDYVRLLLTYWHDTNLKTEDVIHSSGGVLTFMFNDDDSVKRMDRDGNVIGWGSV